VVRPEELAKAAPLFAALGDETRLGIVTRLCAEGPLSISRLTAGGGVTRQAVTKHLHVLAEAGLAHSSQVGRERIWELEPRPMLTARECLDRISAQWDEALARLRRFVEDEPPSVVDGAADAAADGHGVAVDRDRAG
jgi:DNA-binding transcriptional ArsR family regulator